MSPQLNMFITIALLILGVWLAGICAGKLLKNKGECSDPRDISLYAFFGTAGIGILFAIITSCGLPVSAESAWMNAVRTIVFAQLYGSLVWMFVRSSHRSPYVLVTHVAFVVTFSYFTLTGVSNAYWLLAFMIVVTTSVMLAIAIIADALSDNIFPISKFERGAAMILSFASLVFAFLRMHGELFILL